MNMIDSNIKKEILVISIGSLLFNLIVLFICLFFIFTNLYKIDIIYITLGLLMGFIISVIYTYHMAVSLNKSIDFPDEKTAESFYKKQRLLRQGLIILFFILVSKFINTTVAIFGMIGLFGIKVGAYFSPIIKKYMNM